MLDQVRDHALVIMLHDWRACDGEDALLALRTAAFAAVEELVAIDGDNLEVIAIGQGLVAFEAVMGPPQDLPQAVAVRQGVERLSTDHLPSCGIAGVPGSFHDSRPRLLLIATRNEA